MKRINFKISNWIESNFHNLQNFEQRKIESLFIGDFIFSILLILYIFFQYQPSMDSMYFIYFLGHSITALGFLSSFIFLILKKQGISVWILYIGFVGTSIATVMVPFLESGDYYFFMFNIILGQTTLLMLYLFINIVAIKKIHQSISILILIVDNFSLITYYTFIGTDHLLMLSILIPSGLGFIINVYVISRLHHLQINNLRENQKQIKSLLGKSKDRVEKLEKILPICSMCKTIRKNEDEWIEIEDYIRDESKMVFSHSLCPKCAKKYYNEYFD